MTEIFEFEDSFHFGVLDVAGKGGGGLIFFVRFLIKFRQTDDRFPFDVTNAVSVPVTFFRLLSSVKTAGYKLVTCFA